MYTRGVEGQEGFKSFRYTSLESPYFPRGEWEEARRQLPEDVFRQEYMAEFLEDSAGVFRGIDACLFDSAVGNQQSAGGSEEKNRTVIVGCDIAKHTDWTVCVAIDAKTGRCLDLERFNQLDWPLQRDRIAAFVSRWQARLVMDATGVGDPIYDDLRRVLPQVEGFKITAQNKRELVQGLMVAVEQRRVAWPAATGDRSQESEGRMGCGTGDWEVLTAEMKRYEYQIGPTGQVSYAAPSGYHDDCVMALALAVWGMREFGSAGGFMGALPGFRRDRCGGSRVLTLA